MSLPRLPTLIFADENHLSPFLNQVLLKLVPQLQKAGYQQSFFEIPSKLSLEECQSLAIDSLIAAVMTLVVTESLVNEFCGYLLRSEQFFTEIATAMIINKLAELIKFAEAADATPIQQMPVLVGSKQVVLKASMKDILMPAIGLLALLESTKSKNGAFSQAIAEFKKFQLNAIEAWRSHIELLDLLAQSEIEYKGIDSNNRPLLLTNNNPPESLDAIFDGLKESGDFANNELANRNKRMIETYLQNKRNAFGITGLAHLEGMQKLLSQDNTVKPDDFKFIYLFHEPVDGMVYQKIELLKKIRSGEGELPLGIILIDAINVTPDEAAVLAFKEIEKQILAKVQRRNVYVTYPTVFAGHQRNEHEVVPPPTCRV